MISYGRIGKYLIQSDTWNLYWFNYEFSPAQCSAEDTLVWCLDEWENYRRGDFPRENRWESSEENRRTSLYREFGEEQKAFELTRKSLWMLLNCTVLRMVTLTYCVPFIAKPLESHKFARRKCSVVVCGAKGPRPRYPRVWKTQKKIGTISKSAKLVECIKGLSNIKEEFYGALDSFIAWDLEFPLIVVKKALKTLEYEKEWKKIIQVSKWMLSKGQGRTMGTYLALLTALVEDDRLDEAEELWTKVFSENLESTPRTFFEKMVAVYYHKGMHDKLFEIFADMDELGIYPTVSIVTMVGNVFQELGMTDKYQKLMRKYPPQKYEYKYMKGKRVKVPVKHIHQPYRANQNALAQNATKVSTSDTNESDAADGGVDEVISTNSYSTELLDGAAETSCAEELNVEAFTS